MEDTVAKFTAIQLDPKVIDSIKKNKKVVARLSTIVGMAGGKAEKAQGNLLYALSTKLPPSQDNYMQACVDCIMAGKWTKVMQLEEASSFLKEKLNSIGNEYKIDQVEFEKASGVGINVTDADVQALLDKAFANFGDDIKTLGWDFQWSKILYWIKEQQKWADSKVVMAKMMEMQVKLLGEKPKAAPKLNVPKVPFKIQVSQIGACLQLTNFEFLYGQLYKKIKTGKQKPGENFISDKEFHAALQLLSQFLYLIRDMASSDNEKNQHNAKILSQNVFYNDLCIVSHFALNLYDARKHSVQFLHDTVEFTHLMLEMLDEYSKGKVLTVQTQRKRKIKKAKKKQQRKARQSSKQENSGDLQEFGQQEDDIYFDSDDNEFGEEFSDDEENVERKFNFVSEISVLVDYNVITKYISVLKDYDHLKRNPQLVKACAHFFKRVVNQTKQTWIFFQASTLSVMNEFNQRGVTTNSLMRGLNETKPVTTLEKQLHSYSLEMKQVINQIAGKFIELIQKNQLAAVEVLFKFPSRQLKDQILNNYDEHQISHQQTGTSVSRAEKEEIKEIQDIIDINNFAETDPFLDQDEEKPEVTLGFQDEAPEAEEKPTELVWTQEMDDLLITNFENFKSLGSECYQLITELIPGTTEKQCKERGHVLKLKKNSTEAARDLSRKLISKQSSSLMGKKVGVAFRQFVSAKLAQKEATELPRQLFKDYLDYVRRIHKEYSAFREQEDNLVLFGGDLEMADLKREAQLGKKGGMRDASQMKCPFVLVPVNVDDFDKLSDPCFLQLLACFGVKVGSKQNVFPRIEGTVSKQQMAEAAFAMETFMMEGFQRVDGVASLAEVDMEGTLSLETFS